MKSIAGFLQSAMLAGVLTSVVGCVFLTELVPIKPNRRVKAGDRMAVVGAVLSAVGLASQRILGRQALV